MGDVPLRKWGCSLLSMMKRGNNCVIQDKATVMDTRPTVLWRAARKPMSHLATPRYSSVCVSLEREREWEWGCLLRRAKLRENGGWEREARKYGCFIYYMYITKIYKPYCSQLCAVCVRVRYIVRSASRVNSHFRCDENTPEIYLHETFFFINTILW